MENSTKARIATGAVLLTAGAAALAGWLRWRDTCPPLLSGGLTARIELVGDGPTASTDASKMIARIEALGGQARVEASDGDRIRLRVDRIRSIDDVALVLGAGAFAAHRVLPLPAIELPDGIVMVPAEPSRPPRWRAADCATLESLADSATSAGCTIGLEPPNLLAAFCTGYCLAPSAEFTDADVDASEVREDPREGWLVERSLSEAGRRRFERMTREARGTNIAFVVDGRVTGVPIVAATIPGTKLTLPAVPPSRATSMLLQAHAERLGHTAEFRYRSHWRVVGREP